MRLGTMLAFYTVFLVFGLLGWYFWDRLAPTIPSNPAQVVAIAKEDFPQQKPPQNDTKLNTMAEEQADLKEAQALLTAESIDSYQTLRKEWNDKEMIPEAWFFLDAHALLLQGKRQNALELLSSKRFAGNAESERLIQLAALYMVENPSLADAYLSEALHTDPDNPDLHLFKANLLDSQKQYDAALTEYIKAVQKDPRNLYLREHLADFFLSRGRYPEAVAILQDTLAPPSLDSLWLKALFWSKVTIPLKNNAGNNFSAPRGKLTPFVAYLEGLPSGIYWNQNTFKSLPEAEYYLNNLQATFWLRLIAALKSGDEQTALQLIEINPFHATSWMPELEKSLKTILVYRQASPTNIKESSPIKTTLNLEEESHQFLTFLAGLSTFQASELAHVVPPELRECLLGNEALALPFLVSGWNEAALQLHQIAIIPETYPRWIPWLLTKALRQNRGTVTALEWASAQKPNPDLSLMIAELALATHQKTLAIGHLKIASSVNSPAGLEAALLLGQLFLDENNTVAALDIFQVYPTLTQEMAGKELLARIAIKDNQIDTAYNIYTSIEKDSLEAKSFLVRYAFDKKDWKQARKLTQELLEKHPDNVTLKENLKRISLREKVK